MTSHVYFINLDRVPDRAEFMRGQFGAAGIADPIRVSAVDAAQSDMSRTERYAPRSWGEWWTLRPTEIAVFESHRSVWQRILDAGHPGAIFEDDVLLSKSAGQIIQNLGAADGFDMVKLDALAGQVRLGTEHHIGGHCLRPIRQVLPSAAAYLLTPRGANLLLRHSQRYCDHLDDFITRPWPAYRMFQLLPGIAAQGMFLDLARRPDIPGSIVGSERTDFGRAPVHDGRGPVPYRLWKELRRSGRKLSRRLGADRKLVAQGGQIAEVPLAADLPGYKR